MAKRKRKPAAAKSPAAELMTWDEALKLGRPSREELASLPRRSIVAFAARCALRVQPLYLPESDEQIQAVDTAIQVTADFARGKPVSREKLAAAAAAADADAATNAANAANAAYAANAANAANAAARLDFEFLKSRGGAGGQIGGRINPLNEKLFGELWHGHDPNWYAEKKAELDRRLGKSSAPADLKSQLKSVSQQKGDLQQRVEQLQKELASARQKVQELTNKSPDKELHAELDSLRGRLDELDSENRGLKKSVSEAESAAKKSARQSEDYEAQVERLQSEIQDAEARFQKSRQELKSAETEIRDLSDRLDLMQKQLEESDENRRKAEDRLSYREDFSWENVKKRLTIENALLLFAFVVVILAGWLSLLAISEVSARQQMVSIINSQMEEARKDLVFSTTQNGEDIQEETRSALAKLLKAKTNLLILIASGTTDEPHTLAGIRDQLQDVPPQRETAKDTESASSCLAWISWLRPDISRWSSDLLLSIIVIVAGFIGGVIATIRDNTVFTAREFVLGLAAGLITFLVIRSGRAVFLMQLDGASYILNPHTSAFFGLTAGLFTDRAYLLLVGIVEKMKENLDGSFDLQLESIRDTGHRAKKRTKDLPATVDVSAGKPLKPEETTSDSGSAG